MATVLMAIDPGKSGAIALQSGPNDTIAVYGLANMSESEIVTVIRVAKEAGHVEATMEKVGGFIGKPQTGSSMFTFGRNTGLIMGALLALQIPVNEVIPQKWQAFVGAGTKGKRTPAQWKRHLRDIAKKLYPNMALTDKTADAVLILAYARSR